jgi:hypothetical protein
MGHQGRSLTRYALSLQERGGLVTSTVSANPRSVMQCFIMDFGIIVQTLTEWIVRIRSVNGTGHGFHFGFVHLVHVRLLTRVMTDKLDHNSECHRGVGADGALRHPAPHARRWGRDPRSLRPAISGNRRKNGVEARVVDAAMHASRMEGAVQTCAN